MPVQFQTKSVVSVAEMARMCALSRARFYQLMNEGIFPPPLYDVATRRPFFTEDMQIVCVEVRRRNCGINGKPVLFYSPRHPLGQQPKQMRKPTTAKPDKGKHAELLDGLKALGLESVTVAQVDSVVQTLFPNGVEKLEAGGVIRRVFLHFKRQDTRNNVVR
jgi:hypothetical protein